MEQAQPEHPARSHDYRFGGPGLALRNRSSRGGIDGPNVPDLKRPVYYLAGPPGMVTAVKKLLLDRGVSRDNVRFEEFTGY